MKKTEETLREKTTTKRQLLHLSFELSNTKWKLASSDGKKVRTKGIDARKVEWKGGRLLLALDAQSVVLIGY